MSFLLHLPQPLALLPRGNHGYQFLGEHRRGYAHTLCLHVPNIEHLLYANLAALNSAVNKDPCTGGAYIWWVETENEI